MKKNHYCLAIGQGSVGSRREPYSIGGGLCPTLTAEMGGHGNNYVYILEEQEDGGCKNGKNKKTKD